MNTILIIAGAVAFFMIALIGAGNETAQTESASDPLDRCVRCGNYLPCSCDQNDDTSYGHHHHHDRWADDSMSTSSREDSYVGHADHHHNDAGHWG
ncbi:hypothetical protein [Burkholderia contaminans]|uniref:hypothetical protein n=1 Tax=Burkholderia contaminans TaxID=488447 RepID=UPI0011B201BA|nr:hypothetical protein [Burkholderia contaminans]